MRLSSYSNISMILQILFTKIAKTPAKATATLGMGLPGVGMRWVFGKEGATWAGRMLADRLTTAVCER